MPVQTSQPVVAYLEVVCMSLQPVQATATPIIISVLVDLAAGPILQGETRGMQNFAAGQHRRCRRC